MLGFEVIRPEKQHQRFVPHWNSAMWLESKWSAMFGLGLLAVVALGFNVGSSARFRDCDNIVSLSVLCGVGFAIAALCHTLPCAKATKVERFAGGAVIFYVILATGLAPFGWVNNASGLISSIAWLLPLVAGGLILPRSRCWFAGFGCWAVLFGCVAALTYTVTHPHSGVGMFFRWME